MNPEWDGRGIFVDGLRPDVKICQKIHLNNRLCSKSCSHFLPPTVFTEKMSLNFQNPVSYLVSYHLHKLPGWKSWAWTYNYEIKTWWENGPLQSISKLPEQTKKGRKIASPQITDHILWSFPNGMSRSIWFSIRNFRLSHLNGKYPCAPFILPKYSASLSIPI